MHDLVKNLDDRFSHYEPHSKLVPIADFSDIKSSRKSCHNISHNPFINRVLMYYLDLLNKLGKRDKLHCFAEHFIAFLQQVQFSNSGAGILDYIYHMTLELF